VEGVQICTWPTNNTKGYNRFTNNDARIFQHVSLPKELNLTRKQDKDKKWATFLYEINILSIKIVKITSRSWTYYKPPSYYGLSLDLLKKSKVNVSKHVIKRTQNSIKKYGATICFNGCGWDNVAWHSLLNVMLIYPNGNVFIGSIDTIGTGRMPNTYVMHWLDASKPLELTTLYKFIKTIFWACKRQLNF
jgi:hypothetical protein